MKILLNDRPWICFVAALALIVPAFAAETILSMAFDEWMQTRKRRLERPRFPCTDRTGT